MRWLLVAALFSGCSQEPASNTAVCALKEAQRDAKTFAQILEATEGQLSDLCEKAYGDRWFLGDDYPDGPACAHVEYRPLPGVLMDCES